MKNLKYYLFFLGVVSYILYLLSRIILERVPAEPVVLTGILCIFPISLIVIKQVFRVFILLYTKLKKKEEEKEEEKNANKAKSNFFYQIIKICGYPRIFIESFLKEFWIHNTILSKSSLWLNEFLKLNFNQITLWLRWIAIIPWLSSLGFLFYELMLGQNNLLYLCLYFFSLNVLIRKIIDVFLFLSSFENKLMFNKAFENHFIVFEKDSLVKNFFLLNPFLRNSLLFYSSYENNKKMIQFLRTESQRIMIANFYYIGLEEFIKIDWYWLKKFTQEINLLVFLTSFSILILNEFTIIKEAALLNFVVIGVLFGGSFVAFLVFLKFLEGYPSSPDMLHRKKFQDLEELFYFMFDWFEETEAILLKKGFSPNELVNFKSEDTVDYLHAKRFFEETPLTEEEWQVLLSIQYCLIEYCYEKIKEKKFDFDRFTFKL